MKIHSIPFHKLTISDFIEAAESSARLKLHDKARGDIAAGSSAVQSLIKNKKVVYGVNTGVGDLCDSILANADLLKLQKNIVLSHACGTAPYFEEKTARGALFLVINSRAKGFSGIKQDTIEKLISIFNARITPLLPTQGSLGASGDLIPLAHLALMLLGKGNVFDRGKMGRASDALKRIKIKPHIFQPKEALCLINGTDVVTSAAAFAVSDAENVLTASHHATAAMFEILGASRSSLDSELHALKPHSGQVTVARHLQELLKGSVLLDRPKKKVQDSYVVRCAPQIDGAVLGQIEKAKNDVEIEINSVTDNPLFFKEKDSFTFISGGNFHAQSIAFAMDSLGIALTALGKVMERRIERLINPSLNNLTPFLTYNGGLHSGFMVPHYLVASLVAENSVYAHPASIQSVSVSAGQEDFVSMAMTAANKATNIIRNCEKILAIELLVVVQAMDVMKKKRLASLSSFSPSARSLYKMVRAKSPSLEEDRSLSKDIEHMVNLIRARRIAS